MFIHILLMYLFTGSVFICIRVHLVLVKARQNLLIRRLILQQNLVMLLVVKKLN